MRTRMAIFALSLFTIISCESSEEREAATIKWIESAERPIICKRYTRGELYATYTLFSANGKVFTTGGIKMELTDTIK